VVYFRNCGDELMATYAQLDEENIVLNIVDADNDWIALQPGTWIEYTDAKRAYIGGTYDDVDDVFIAPAPFNSWYLDENYDWQPPVPYPDGEGMFVWDEANEDWVLSF
jgi:hypothetical protein